MEQIPQIPKEKFKLVHDDNNKEQEKIGTPSLTYMQDVRRRLFKSCCCLLDIVINYRFDLRLCPNHRSTQS